MVSTSTVFANQAIDLFAGEMLLHPRGAGTQGRAHVAAQVISKPAVERHTEAALTSCQHLATPAMGHPPLIRLAAVDGDGATAYARNRDSLAALRR